MHFCVTLRRHSAARFKEKQALLLCISTISEEILAGVKLLSEECIELLASSCFSRISMEPHGISVVTSFFKENLKTSRQQTRGSARQVNTMFFFYLALAVGDSIPRFCCTSRSAAASPRVLGHVRVRNWQRPSA